MLKRMRRLLPVQLCIIMVLSLSMVAFASSSVPKPPEPSLDPTDINMSVMSAKNSVKDDFVSGAREATKEAIERAKNIEKPKPKKIEKPITKGNTISSSEASWEYLDLDRFYYYGQEKNYSCGAASVRMALKYLTGTKYSESTIRNGCDISATTGALLEDMKKYANDEQDSNHYVERYQQSKSDMKDDLHAGITSYNAPPVIGVQESTDDGWPYDMPAHFVAIYGAYSDQSYFSVADPWAGYAGDNDNKWYTLSDDDLYTGYDAVDVGYMY